MIYIYIYTSICIIVTAKKIEPYFQGLYRRCCFCTISYYFPHIHAPILHQTSEYLRDDEVARQHIGYGFHDLGIWWNSDAVSDAWRCQKWTTCEDILRNYLLSTTDYNSILIYIYILYWYHMISYMAYTICQRLSCRVHGHRSAAVISRLLQSERTPLTNQLYQLLSVENFEQTFANSGNIYMKTHQLIIFDSSEMLNGYGPALARLWPYSCADFEGDEVPPFCWASCIAHTRVLLKCLSALDLRNAWNLSTNPPTKLQITATPSIIINMRMASWINMNQHLRWPHVFTSQSPQRCVNSR